MPDTTVIGTGGLGSTLVQALSDNNIPIKSVFNRTVEKAQAMSAKADIDFVSSFPSSPDQLGSLIFITVADRAIETIAQQLANLDHNFSGHTVVHCSGNMSAEVLTPVKEEGAAVASFHPLQTFTKESVPDRFEEIFFSLQGDKQAFGLLKNIADKFNARILEVNAQQKSDLHAAAVLASNYLTSLLDTSVQTASLSGLSELQAKKALMPLIKTTLKNVEETTFENALTGPIKRGDLETVRQHLQLLEDQPALVDVYITLGRRTTDFAEQSGFIDNQTVKKLQKIFNDYM